MYNPISYSASDTLMRAKALVEYGWVQGNFAVDANGKYINPSDVGAVAYCAEGAMCAFSSTVEVGLAAMALFEQAIGSNRGIISWNDTPGRTKQEVLEKFDEAIKLAQTAEVG